MKKIIIIFSFLLMISQLVSAQVEEGAKIVTVSQAFKIGGTEDVKVKNGADEISIQLQIGTPFFYNKSISPVSEDGVSIFFRYPWDINYTYLTFSEGETAFDVSKGYFGDKILVRWEIKNNYDLIKLIKIYKRKYTIDNSENWAFVSNVSKDDTQYEDLYVDGGVLYEYKVEADGLDDKTLEFEKFITGIGFRNPTATVTGNVSFDGGTPVPDVVVKAEPDGTTLNQNKGTALQIEQNSFIKLENIKNSIDKQATLQAWVKPVTAFTEDTDSAIRLFNLNALKEENREVSVTYLPSLNSLKVEVGDAEFLVKEYLPKGELDDSGAEKMIPVSDFNTEYTHFTVIIDHNKSPQLYINGRPINSVFQKTIRAITIPNTTPITHPYELFEITTPSEKINLITANENKWNKIQIGGNHKILLDEVRIWNSVLSIDDIRTDFKRYISGNNDNLISYLRLEENVGEDVYDFSRTGFNFHKNNAKFDKEEMSNNFNNITWTSVVPEDNQLGVLGVTDASGNYQITGIPYKGAGEAFTISPKLGKHQFEPGKKLVFLGEGETVANQINFIDKSSFLFSAKVLYDSKGFFPAETLDNITENQIVTDGYYNAYFVDDYSLFNMGEYWLNNDGKLEKYSPIYVKGANIYIDGEIVVDSNNIPVTTNETTGLFEIRVPIGNHFIEVKKEGHVFSHEGRFPKKSTQQEYNTRKFFQDSETPVYFIDQTKVTVVGRVVGGVVQAQKTLGFGKYGGDAKEGKTEEDGFFKYSWTDDDGIPQSLDVSSKDNIGVAEITIGYAPSGSPTDATKYTFKTIKGSGEFREEMLPLEYILGKNGIKNIFSETIPILEQKIILDWTSIKDTITPKFAVSPGDTLFGKKYNHQKKFTYKATPEINIVAQTSDETVTITEENTDGDLVKRSIRTKGLKTAEGIETLIYSQFETYSITMEAYEKYENKDINGSIITDLVPLLDGKFDIKNPFELDGSQKLLDWDDTGTIKTYLFKAGKINATTPYTFDIKIIYKLDNEQYTPVDGSYIQKAIVIGGESDGSTTFFTEAPDQVAFILRDPPGSQSFASIEKGTSFTISEKFNTSNSLARTNNQELKAGAMFQFGAPIGPITRTTTVNDIKSGGSQKLSSQNGNSMSKQFTFNQTISTSNDPNWVGSDADLYVGNSKNIYYGAFSEIIASPTNEGGLKLENLFDDVIYIDKRIDKAFSEDPTGTFFIYSQRHILDKIIPELEDFIEDIETDPDSVDYEDEAKKEQHLEQIRQWSRIIQENEKAKFDASFNREDVRKRIKDNLEAQIAEYNLYAPEIDQVLNGLSSVSDVVKVIPPFIWAIVGAIIANQAPGSVTDKYFSVLKLLKDVVLLLSEKQVQRRATLAFIENEFEKNISLDSGVGEFSFTSEINLIGRKERTMKLNLDSEFKKATGIKINEIGTVVENGLDKTGEIALAYESENSETNIVKYTIKDDDNNNFLSVDVVNAFDGNGPIFSIKGGRTSCPFEDESKSLFYNEIDFENAFQQAKTDLNSIDKAALVASWLTSDFSQAAADVLSKDNNIENLKNEKAKNIALTKIHSGKEIYGAKTQQIEDPRILVSGEDKPIGIPTQGTAEFELQLSNQSIVETDTDYLLRVIDNPKSAKINIEPNGTIVQIPKGKTLNFKMLLEQGSLEDFEYKDIVVRLESLCEAKTIYSQVTISAAFVPACTEVVISSPASNFIYNIDKSSDPLDINISGFSSSFDGFKKIELQYRKSTEAEWTLLQTFLPEEFYDIILEGNLDGKTKIESSSISYPFDISEVSNLQEGKHEIEISAISYCGSDANPVKSFSSIISGTVDLNAPIKFGTPLPIDGVLGVGEDLKVVFNENITFDSSVSKILIKTETNQLPVHHDVSISFEDSSNTVSISKPRIISGDFSIEFWLNNLKPNSAATIFSQDNGAALEGVNIALNNNNEMIVTLGGINVISGTIKSDKDFHHYTITYVNDTGETVIVQDADALTPLTQTLTPNLNFNSENDLIIGGNTFEGNVYDLRLWSKLFTESQSNANKYLKFRGNEKDLLGYYPMIKGRGDFANDLAFFKHGKVNASWDIKPKGNSYDFLNDNYLELDNSNVLLTAKMDATISFWVKTGKKSQESTIFSNGKGDGTEPILTNGFSNTWALNMSNGNLSLDSEGITYLLTEKNIDDDKWHHVAVLFDRLGVLLTYIDGEQVSTNPINEIGGFTANRILIGARGHIVDKTKIDRKFFGKIDEFRIWNSLRGVNQIIRDQYFEIDYQSVGLILNTRFNKPKEYTGLGPQYYRYSPSDEENIPIYALRKDYSLSYSDFAPAIKPARMIEDLNVSRVIKDNEIVFSPKTTTWNKLEGQILDLSVVGMRDEAGNVQESAITWSAFVQKNEVKWFVEDHNEVVELIKYKGDEKSFEITLVNSGGSTEQFSISNIPNWLNLTNTSGVISPDSKRIITATIDENLAANIYNEILYLETDFGINLKLPIRLRVLEQEPDWSVNPNEFTSSSNIIGQIKVEGIFSDDIYDKIAVFHNDEVRGFANLQYNDSYKQYYAFLTFYSNVGKQDDTGSNGDEILNFKIWDASQGKVLEAQINDGQLTIPFIPNNIMGNFADPIVFENTNAIEQDVSFNEGWTWVSFNVNDNNFSNINELTKNIALKTNDRIIQKAPVRIETYTDGFGWDGTISQVSGGLSSDKMYKVYLSNEQSLKIKGPLVDINNFKFPVAIGWNWLPFSLPYNILLSDAFANYDAKGGDVIKSQNLFAFYDDNVGWIGSLSYLEDGKGYMLKAGIDQDFKFPEIYSKFSSKGKQQENISTEFSGYSKTMNAIVLIPEGYEELVVLDTKKTTKGFVKQKNFGSKQLCFITIYGENSEDLEFYLKKGKSLEPTSRSFTFNNNTVLGTFEKPVDLREGDFEFLVTPNPFKEEFLIQVYEEEENVISKVLLYSSTGQLVFSEEFNLNKGLNSLVIRPKISNGVYLMHFINKDKTIIKKVVKE